MEGWLICKISSADSKRRRKRKRPHLKIVKCNCSTFSPLLLLQLATDTRDGKFTLPKILFTLLFESGWNINELIHDE